LTSGVWLRKFVAIVTNSAANSHQGPRGTFGRIRREFAS
jgi:hypothetical protein